MKGGSEKPLVKRNTSAAREASRITSGKGAGEFITSPGHGRGEGGQKTRNENNLSKNGNKITISGLWKRQTNEGVADS
jgi:hypothetical protein